MGNTVVGACYLLDDEGSKQCRPMDSNASDRIARAVRPNLVDDRRVVASHQHPIPGVCRTLHVNRQKLAELPDDVAIMAVGEGDASAWAHDESLFWEVHGAEVRTRRAKFMPSVGCLPPLARRWLEGALGLER